MHAFEIQQHRKIRDKRTGLETDVEIQTPKVVKITHSFDSRFVTGDKSLMECVRIMTEGNRSER